MSDRRGYLAFDEQSQATLKDACLLFEHLESIAGQLKGTGRAMSNLQSSIDRAQADLEILIRQDQRTRRSFFNDDIKKFARPDEQPFRALPLSLGSPQETVQAEGRG